MAGYVMRQFTCPRCVCYYDNSKLRASIFTKLGLYAGIDRLQPIIFWLSRATGKGSAAGQIFWAPPYYSQRAVFASLLSAFLLLAISAYVHDVPRTQLIAKGSAASELGNRLHRLTDCLTKPVCCIFLQSSGGSRHGLGWP